MPRSGEHALPVAQYLRMREQIPSLYGLLSVNAIVLAFAHRFVAPPLLSFWVPFVLTSLCIVRMLAWMRPLRTRDLSVATARMRLRRAAVIAMALSLIYVCWAIALAHYGGPIERSQLGIFVALTVLGCIYCLSFLPSAAVVVCVTALGIFTGYCFWLRSGEMVAMSLNVALVAGMFLWMLRNSYRAFVELETSQRELRSERRQAQLLGEENARLAQTDALTTLPNRRFFFSALEERLIKAKGSDVFVVGLIDLDRFKPVNDTHGHALGDRLLEIIGQRLKAACPEGAIIARLGGDEFGLLANGDADQAERVAQVMCSAIREPARIGDTVVTVGCSAGLAVYPDTGDNTNLLFDRADFALYHAKRQRRGQCVRFSEELEHLVRSEQTLDAALQEADLVSELFLVHQPIVSTETMAPLAVECLARWNSPRLGFISPERLIATAERIGRSREVTLALFDKALATLAALPDHLRLSFNLSGLDLCDAETISALLERLQASGHEPRRLLIEITETTLIEKLDIASVALERLREKGVKIALDDFGTGYSSLSWLHQLPLDVVKIDRSFAARLAEPAGRRLLGAIRNLVRSLSLECVVEGIETEAQLVNARLAGFSLAQGYYFARPVPLDELLRSIAPPSQQTALAS